MNTLRGNNFAAFSREDNDMLAGDEPDDHNSDWTQKQVRQRTGRSLPELLDEWRSLRTPLVEWIALVGDSWMRTSRGGVDDAEVVVEATDFDLARSLVSRRSEKQLRNSTTRGAIAPYLDSFATLGQLPDDDLTETF
jgi:hypothetical protein